MTGWETQSAKTGLLVWNLNIVLQYCYAHAYLLLKLISIYALTFSHHVVFNI